VVVARRSLGTLNHTLLTLEVARHRGLVVRGVIVNETSPPTGVADETNVTELRARCDVLGVLPFGADEVAVDWWSLVGGGVK
jgi:dethiobiotin synthetase